LSQKQRNIKTRQQGRLAEANPLAGASSWFDARAPAHHETHDSLS
jgi:hypothetical protein